MPAAWLYEQVIKARNARYDRGLNVQRLNLPVISIGNITVGGTGKTPLVQWIVRHLCDNGHSPAIAMRGYGARNGKLSDEQAEYQWRVPNVPVIANPQRYEAVSDFLKTNNQIDCVVLDDGFQHRQLHRDLDVLLIDATADTFHDYVLPAGRLREPLKNMTRADAVIVTRATAVIPKLDEQILRYHGKPALAWAKHSWTNLLVTDSTGEHFHPTSWLAGKRIVTMLGVGNPKSIEQQIESVGAHTMATVPAGDHERYDRAKLATARGLSGGADAMIVTGKDWVKLRQLIHLDWPCPIVVPELTVEVFHGENDLRSMVIKTVQEFRKKHPR